MSEDHQRKVVRKYVANHHDPKFKASVFALNLLYRRDQLALLFNMAIRAGMLSSAIVITGE